MSDSTHSKPFGSVLVITGMHRSGTSLLASAMQRAGVAIGDRLLGPTQSNVHGHFEDLSFLELHEGILADNGLSWYDVGPHSLPVVSAERRQQAQSLLDAREHLPVWGWKDPRTCLFLDFWDTLLPGAKFLFIFRRPEEVLASLRRRQDSRLFHQFRGAWLLRQIGFDTFRARAALRQWMHSNMLILEFAGRHPERCRVLEVSELHNQLPRIVRDMRETWQLPIHDIELGDLLDQRLLRPANSSSLTRRARSPEVAQILDSLRHLADHYLPNR